MIPTERLTLQECRKKKSTGECYLVKKQRAMFLELWNGKMFGRFCAESAPFLLVRLTSIGWVKSRLVWPQKLRLQPSPFCNREQDERLWRHEMNRWLDSEQDTRKQSRATRRALSPFWSFKTRRKTFLNCIQFVDQRILRLKNFEWARREKQQGCKLLACWLKQLPKF